MKLLLLILALAAAFAFPSYSPSRKRQRTEEPHLVDNSLDFNQLLSLKLWKAPKNDQVRVYLQPVDETDTNRLNRDEFMEKFTVGEEIFNQLLLIKNQVTGEEDIGDDFQEIPVSKVKSDILPFVLNFAFWNIENQIDVESFRYLSFNIETLMM